MRCHSAYHTGQGSRPRFEEQRGTHHTCQQRPDLLMMVGRYSLCVAPVGPCSDRRTSRDVSKHAWCLIQQGTRSGSVGQQLKLLLLRAGGPAFWGHTDSLAGAPGTLDSWPHAQSSLYPPTLSLAPAQLLSVTASLLCACALVAQVAPLFNTPSESPPSTQDGSCICTGSEQQDRCWQPCSHTPCKVRACLQRRSVSVLFLGQQQQQWSLSKCGVSQACGMQRWSTAAVYDAQRLASQCHETAQQGVQANPHSHD